MFLLLLLALSLAVCMQNPKQKESKWVRLRFVLISLYNANIFRMRYNSGDFCFLLHFWVLLQMLPRHWQMLTPSLFSLQGYLFYNSFSSELCPVIGILPFPGLLILWEMLTHSSISMCQRQLGRGKRYIQYNHRQVAKDMKSAYEITPDSSLYIAIMDHESFLLAVKVVLSHVRRKAAHISLTSPCLRAQVWR